MKQFESPIADKGYLVEEEIKLFEADQELRSKMELVINHYFALSVASLQATSVSIRYNKDEKFERLMSGHEDIVDSELRLTHKICRMRQLLICNKHVDFYLPAFHVCLEPGDPKYNASGRRANREEYSDLSQKRIGGLFSIRVESYMTTRQDLTKYINSLRITNKKSAHQIEENFYLMACHTLPYFIRHKTFSSLINNGNKFQLVQ